MQVLDTQNQFCGVKSCSLFREVFFFAEMLEELTPVDEVHNKVQVAFCEEVRRAEHSHEDLPLWKL